MEIKKNYILISPRLHNGRYTKGEMKKYPSVSSLVEREKKSTNVLASVHDNNYPNFLTNPFVCPYRTNYKS